MPFWFASTKRPVPTPANTDRSNNKKPRKEEPTPAVGMSDDPTMEPATPRLLNWRMEPSKTFPDWTIVVQAPGTEKEEYPIHRSMMLASEAFSRLVSAQAPGGCTVLHVTDEAAELFPDFLDYNYHVPVVVSPANAVPLYYLSRVMGLTRLRWEARRVWEDDLCLDNLDYYYDAALVYGEDCLLKAVKDKCIDESILEGITVDSKVLSVSSPCLLEHMVNALGEVHGDHLSILVSSFLDQHSATIDAATFHNLTGPLATIAWDAVPILLEMYRSLGATAATPGATGNELSNFEWKCITALASCWDGIDLASFASTLSAQSPAFLTELYIRSMHQAQEDIGVEATEDEELGSEDEMEDEDENCEEEEEEKPSAVAAESSNKREVPPEECRGEGKVSELKTEKTEA